MAAEQPQRPSLIMIIGGGFIALCVVAPIVGKLAGVSFKEEPPPTAQQTAPDTVITVQAASPKERKKVDAAVALFKKTCGPLMRYWSDVKTASARLRRHESLKWAPLQAKEGGWQEEVEIEVEMKRSEVRHQQVVDWGAMGHTLHYRIGAGKRPGIVAFKKPGKLLCDIPVSKRGVSIRPLPEAAALGLAGSTAK